MAVAVIGGGISGLALAQALFSQGKSAVVHEAAERAGGTIQTRLEEGFLTEAGPNGFLDSEPKTLELAQALGLGEKLRPAEASAKRRFIFARGRLREVPSSPLGFFASDILPLGARLRVLGEPFTPRVEQEDESLASFATRHLGRTAAATLIDAMQSGIFAGDFEKLSIRSTFPKLAEIERAHRSLVVGLVKSRKPANPSGPKGTLTSFEGGLETLVSTLATRLGPALRLGSNLVALSPAHGRWKLTVEERGVRSTFEASRVVLAIPSFQAAELVRPFDDPLAALLGDIPYSKVAVVHLGFEKAALSSAPHGFGFLVPSQEKRQILGALFVSSFFPWRSQPDRLLLTCMVGGARQGELAGLPDDELISLVRSELQDTLGLSAAPFFTRIVRWNAGIPQYNLGHAKRLVEIDQAIRKFPGLFLAGNAYRGIGMNDCIRNAGLLATQLSAESVNRKAV